MLLKMVCTLKNESESEALKKKKFFSCLERTLFSDDDNLIKLLQVRV